MEIVSYVIVIIICLLTKPVILFFCIQAAVEHSLAFVSYYTDPSEKIMAYLLGLGVSACQGIKCTLSLRI